MSQSRRRKLTDSRPTTALVEPRSDGVHAVACLAAGHSRELARVDHHAGSVVGLVPIDLLRHLAQNVHRVASHVLLGDDHRDDRQTVLARELEVALVAAGDGHDRARAVVHQHVVGDPDRAPSDR